MNPRTSNGPAVSMTAADVANRAAQSRSFLEAARLAQEFASELGAAPSANVVASNAILAGIAAADAICGLALKIRSNSANHGDAIALLKRAYGGTAAANHLKALIAIKSAAAYEPMMVSAAKAAEAIRHAERLVAAMDAMLG